LVQETISPLGEIAQENIVSEIALTQTETESDSPPEPEIASPVEIEVRDDIGMVLENRSSEIEDHNNATINGPTGAIPTDAIDVDPACVHRPLTSRPRRHERFYTNLYQEQ
jgi:hypothetical protein